MTLRELAVWALIAGGGVLELLACAGVALMREGLDKLHYTGPAATGGACLAGAVLVQGGWSLIGLRAILLAALLLVTAPVLAHATGRALHARGEDH